MLSTTSNCGDGEGMGVMDALISIALIEIVSGDFGSRVRSFSPILDSLLLSEQGQHEVASTRSLMVRICVCGPIYLIWARTVSSDTFGRIRRLLFPGLLSLPSMARQR
jgi:hypothetical protein